MSFTKIDYRDETIDYAKRVLEKIRNNLTNLEKTDSGIDITRIGKELDLLSEIVQNLPEKIPKTEIYFKYVDNILQLLEESNQSNLTLLVDIETSLVILRSEIYLAGVLQNIIQNTNREMIKSGYEIKETIKACFPRYEGFNVVVYGATQHMTRTKSFSIKLGEFKYKGAKTESNLSSNQSRSSAFTELMHRIENLVEWEMKKYMVDEYLQVWTVEGEFIGIFSFDFLSYEERYDPSR